MSILGSLIVELKANTASFIEGLNSASKTSRAVGREIEDSFSSLGSVASSAFSAFGPLGATVADTLSKIGESAGGAIQTFGKMGGAMGAAAATGAGAGAAILAVAGASTALATSTAMSIAKMGELAQASGVSVAALSGLSFVGKMVGMDTEQVAKSLERMSKSMFAAATAPAGAVNAYTRLHVALKDTAGQLRGTEDVFVDLAGKFAAIADGPAKTALAMQIFGKAGAELIPTLNKGKAGIEDMLDTAKALGVVLDDQTAQAAIRFKENLETLEAAGSGLSIRLTRELLPALNTLTEFLVSGLKDKNSAINGIIDGFTYLTKVVIATGETIFAAMKSVGAIVGDVAASLIEDFMALWTTLSHAAKLDFSGAVASAKDGLGRIHAVDVQFIADQQKIWGDNAKFIQGVFSPLEPAKAAGQKTFTPDTGPAKQDTVLARIQERIKALGEEAAEWLKVAAAGTQAGILVAEANKKGSDEFHKLLTEASKDKSGAATAAVIKAEDFIKSAAAAGVYGTAIKTLTTELDKQGEKTKEQISDALAMAAAWRTGSAAAIAAAGLNSQFAEQTARVNELAKAYDAEVAAHGRLTPVAKELADGLALETAKLKDAKDAASSLASANLSIELDKQAHQISTLAPYVNALSSSYVQGEDAVRRARIQLELYSWAEDQLAKHIVVTEAELGKKRNLLAEADEESYENKLKEEVLNYDIARQYDDQMTKLGRLKDVAQVLGVSTLGIDAQMYDAQQKLIKQWDDWALKVGTAEDKTHAFFNEIILQGQDAGKKIEQAFLGAYDSITGALAKLATGQKANFKQIFQGLAESVTKTEIQKSIGSLTQSLGLGKVPGLSGKQDGSTEQNALWVQIAKGGPLGALGKGGDTGVGFLGKFFGGKKNGGDASLLGIGKADGSQGSPFYVIPASGVGSLFGNSGSGSGSLFNGGSTGSGGWGDFGGAFASGGDLSPGHWGIAGEKGPEVVKGPATVVPMDKLGTGHKTSITNNFNGLKDTDMMRRSASQMVAQQHRQMSIAYSRS